MRTTLLIASMAATLAMAGCTASTEEKNYKMLEEDRPQFEHEHRPMGRRGEHIHRHFASLADDLEVMVETEAQVETAPPPTGGGEHAVIPTTFEDRSQWEAVTVGPADGRTTHWPVYFRDCPLGDKRVHPVTPEAAFEQYVSDDTSAGWDGANTAGLFVQPLKFFFDLAALPVRLVLTPPLVNQASP